MKIFITLVLFCVIWDSIRKALEHDLCFLERREKIG